jgi:glucokinase
MQVLTGDIGGTNTRLAIFQTGAGGSFDLLLEKTYPSQSHDSIEDVLQRFLTDTGASGIERACFGIAGPVIDQVCSTTNLPWRISAHHINTGFGFSETRLINDLEAIAWSIGHLGESDLFSLNPGTDNPRGNRSVIAAGTGLGEAGLYWDGQGYHPFPSEGGHCDFSPTTPLEFGLYQSLSERQGHVSWENIVSGPGLLDIYDYLIRQRGTQTPSWLHSRMEKIGKAQAISAAGLDASDPPCRETLELFARLYGREAGNHALKIMATGGVYLGGGIAPQILPILKEEAFMEAFVDKGPMRKLMQAMPVRVILNDKAALYGAAAYAIEK